MTTVAAPDDSVTPSGTDCRAGAAVLLRGVDRAAFAVAFATGCAAPGCDVGWVHRDRRRSRAALVAVPSHRPGSRSTGPRGSTLRRARRPTSPTFDAVFAAVFDDAVLGVRPARPAHRADALPPPAPDDALVGRAGAAGRRRRTAAGCRGPRCRRPVGVRDRLRRPLGVPERLPTDACSSPTPRSSDLDPADLELLRRLARAAAQAAGRPAAARRRRTDPDRVDRSRCVPPSPGRGVPAGNRSSWCAVPAGRVPAPRGHGLRRQPVDAGPGPSPTCT